MSDIHVIPKLVLVPPPPIPVDRQAALAAIERWLTQGSEATLSATGAVAALEHRFAELAGRRYAVAVSSGTTALELALRGFGVQAGDEVLLATYDWPAAAAVTLALGAEPLPVDVDPDSGTLSPEALSRAIKQARRPRAVVVTHLGGRPADIEALKAVTDTTGLPLLEDCAQALGATVGQRAVGSYGAVATFSLGPRKLVSAGEGGILVTDDDRLYDRVVALGLHPLAQRLRGVPPNPFHLNARLHPLAPFLALPALDELPDRLTRLRANGQRWVELFDSQPGFTLPNLPEGAEPSWWDFVVCCDEHAWGMPTNRILARLQHAGVPISRGSIPRTIGEILREFRGIQTPPCPNAEAWCAMSLMVPISDAIPEDFGRFVERVGAVILQAYSRQALVHQEI